MKFRVRILVQSRPLEDDPVTGPRRWRDDHIVFDVEAANESDAVGVVSMVLASAVQLWSACR